ncbi:hypothetical protein PSTT_14303 [Puccinia striiformis]|uniref:Uncharacterized protein n=1 Tax=Puccinia striiformis TaxID=27350 RepID=A0A2S4UN34_9BASI|nr:hypothetical protein PSTT_14303 [Puccinia striiformis]
MAVIEFVQEGAKELGPAGSQGSKRNHPGNTRDTPREKWVSSRMCLVSLARDDTSIAFSAQYRYVGSARIAKRYGPYTDTRLVSVAPKSAAMTYNLPFGSLPLDMEDGTAPITPARLGPFASGSQQPMNFGNNTNVPPPPKKLILPLKLRQPREPRLKIWKTHLKHSQN